MSRLHEILTPGKPLIAAHRGVSGGNIPLNTEAAFQAALLQGAEIIELDVTQCADGELFIFHPGMEKPHLGLPESDCLKHMHSAEVRRLRYLNHDGTATPWGLMTLREALGMLRDKCVVNIDKFQRYPADIARVVREMGMQDQVLVKTDVWEGHFRAVEEVAADLPYIAIVRERDEVSEHLRKRPMRYLGAEVLFSGDDSPVAVPAYTEWMHRNHLLTWVNAIVYDSRTLLTGVHTDDTAITGNPDLGWGWLIDRGFDIIQTDWVAQLRAYRDAR